MSEARNQPTDREQKKRKSEQEEKEKVVDVREQSLSEQDDAQSEKRKKRKEEDVKSSGEQKISEGKEEEPLPQRTAQTEQKSSPSILFPSSPLLGLLKSRSSESSSSLSSPGLGRGLSSEQLIFRQKQIDRSIQNIEEEGFENFITFPCIQSLNDLVANNRLTVRELDEKLKDPNFKTKSVYWTSSCLFLKDDKLYSSPLRSLYSTESSSSPSSQAPKKITEDAAYAFVVVLVKRKGELSLELRVAKLLNGAGVHTALANGDTCVLAGELYLKYEKDIDQTKILMVNDKSGAYFKELKSLDINQKALADEIFKPLYSDMGEFHKWASRNREEDETVAQYQNEMNNDMKSKLTNEGFDKNVLGRVFDEKGSAAVFSYAQVASGISFLTEPKTLPSDTPHSSGKDSTKKAPSV